MLLPVDEHFNVIPRNYHNSNPRVDFRLGAGWVGVMIVGDG